MRKVEEKLNFFIDINFISIQNTYSIMNALKHAKLTLKCSKNSKIE